MTTTVQHYLDKGLRGLWYPVLASWEVQSAPVGITRTGEQIVVWRNKDGGFRRWRTAARTAARACRWAGTSGTALPAGITA